LLIVLIGPSGVGKNTLMQRAIADVPGLRQMPTATSRLPRANEQEGREHWFVSLETFGQMIATNALFEYQEVHPGQFYGVPRAQLEQMLQVDHARLIADIDIKGALNLREVFPDITRLIFIEPPSLSELEARIRARGETSEADLQARMARVPMELAFATKCDFRILNDDLDHASQALIGIIHGEAARLGCH